MRPPGMGTSRGGDTCLLGPLETRSPDSSDSSSVGSTACGRQQGQRRMQSRMRWGVLLALVLSVTLLFVQADPALAAAPPPVDGDGLTGHEPGSLPVEAATGQAAAALSPPSPSSWPETRRALRRGRKRAKWRDHEGRWSWKRFGFSTDKPRGTGGSRAGGDGGDGGGGSNGGGVGSRAPTFSFTRFSFANICTPGESD